MNHRFGQKQEEPAPLEPGNARSRSLASGRPMFHLSKMTDGLYWINDTPSRTVRFANTISDTLQTGGRRSPLASGSVAHGTVIGTQTPSQRSIVSECYSALYHQPLLLTRPAPETCSCRRQRCIPRAMTHATAMTIRDKDFSLSESELSITDSADEAVVAAEEPCPHEDDRSRSDTSAEESNAWSGAGDAVSPEQRCRCRRLTSSRVAGLADRHSRLLGIFPHSGDVDPLLSRRVEPVIFTVVLLSTLGALLWLILALGSDVGACRTSYRRVYYASSPSLPLGVRWRGASPLVWRYGETRGRSTTQESHQHHVHDLRLRLLPYGYVLFPLDSKYLLACRQSGRICHPDDSEYRESAALR